MRLWLLCAAMVLFRAWGDITVAQSTSPWRYCGVSQVREVWDHLSSLRGRDPGLQTPGSDRRRACTKTGSETLGEIQAKNALQVFLWQVRKHVDAVSQKRAQARGKAPYILKRHLERIQPRRPYIL